MALDTWNDLSGKVVKELPFSLNGRLQVCVKEIETRYPLHSLCLKKQMLEQKLSKGFPLWDELTEGLEDYCLCITQFYNYLYREEWLEQENSVFLPAEYRFSRQTVRRLDNPALQAGTEFLQLASQMKETLRTLLYANQMEPAAEILNQLLPIIPEDLELIWIRQEFIRRTRS